MRIIRLLYGRARSRKLKAEGMRTIEGKEERTSGFTDNCRERNGFRYNLNSETSEGC